MNKILVPTDFSKAANNALDYAISLAKKMNLDVLLLNAYSMPRSGSAVMIDVSDMLKKDSETKLKEEVDRVEASLGSVNLEARAHNGMAVPTISHVCSTEDIAYIVMGTTGATGLKETFIGSNTASLIRETNVPLIAVPESFSTMTDDFHVAISTDLRHLDSANVFNPLKKMVKQEGGTVHLINISEDLTKVDPTNFVAEAIDVDDIFAGIDHSFKFIENKDIEEGILNYIGEGDVTMLVVVSRKRNFFERLFHKSISKKLTMHSPVPIMVLNE